MLGIITLVHTRKKMNDEIDVFYKWEANTELITK